MAIELGHEDEAHVLCAGSDLNTLNKLARCVLASVVRANSPSELLVRWARLGKPMEPGAHAALLPHAEAPPLSETVEVLDWLEDRADEVFERFARFQSVGASTLEAFNNRVPSLERLPRIVLLVEGTEQLLRAKALREDFIRARNRFCERAHLAGFHAVFIAQHLDRGALSAWGDSFAFARIATRWEAQPSRGLCWVKRVAESLLRRAVFAWFQRPVRS